MLSMNAFGAGVAASVLTSVSATATRHAAATPAAAGKHRNAAATEASVDRGST